MGDFLFVTVGEEAYFGTAHSFPFLLATGNALGNSVGIASAVSFGRVSLASAFVPSGRMALVVLLINCSSKWTSQIFECFVGAKFLRGMLFSQARSLTGSVGNWKTDRFPLSVCA